MWRFAFVFLLAAASVAHAQQQITAYDALKVVERQFHRAAMKRVISVTGVDGDPQPTEWTVLIADRNAPGGARELQVADRGIVGNRAGSKGVAGSVAGAVINTAQLNLDSDGAFEVANYTADKSHTNFDSVSYTLRTNDRGTPVWIVTVNNQSHAPLGTIHISANRGNITRVEGLYHGANMANVEQDPVAPAGTNDEYTEPETNDEGAAVDANDDGDENVIKARIKGMFRRTKRDAKRLFQRVRRPFDEFVERRSR
ncbi:MAG: hypothetical protein ABI946_08040 [Chthoniobacterales bacterium]